MVPAVIAFNASITGLRSLSVSFRLCGYAFKKKKEALNVATMTKPENKTSSSKWEIIKRCFRCKNYKLQLTNESQITKDPCVYSHAAVQI